MRALFLAGCVAALAGCAGLPDQDPNQAWIDVQRGHDDSLQAHQVDERDWQDPRFFQVQPGRHELTMRYQFAVAPDNIGPVPAPQWRDCQLSLTFKDFTAGERYYLKAGSTGFRPWAYLYDQQDRLVGKAKPSGCQYRA